MVKMWNSHRFLCRRIVSIIFNQKTSVSLVIFLFRYDIKLTLRLFSFVKFVSFTEKYKEFYLLISNPFTAGRDLPGREWFNRRTLFMHQLNKDSLVCKMGLSFREQVVMRQQDGNNSKSMFLNEDCCALQ